MESSATREREQLFHDLAARILNRLYARFDVSGLQEDEWSSALDTRLLAQPSDLAPAGSLDTRVLRAILVELPIERGRVKPLRLRHVYDREFDVVDDVMLMCHLVRAAAQGESNRQGKKPRSNQSTEAWQASAGGVALHEDCVCHSLEARTLAEVHRLVQRATA